MDEFVFIGQRLYPAWLIDIAYPGCRVSFTAGWYEQEDYADSG
ncbi:hypothetical protein AAIM60_25085 [Pseudomonas lijiangensis]